MRALTPRLCVLAFSALALAACGAEETAPVTPVTTAAPAPTLDPEPEVDPATTPAWEECERDSDCVAYLGMCAVWYAVRAGSEAAHDEDTRRSIEAYGTGCPMYPDEGPGPQPDVTCDHGRCVRVERP